MGQFKRLFIIDAKNFKRFCTQERNENLTAGDAVGVDAWTGDGDGNLS